MINKESGQMPRVPKSRFNIDAHYHSNNDRPGSFGVRGGYFLKETLQEFDPTFFGITPIEAMWMDPQQRKLLEVVYETFESAGITLQEISGSSTACFVASFTADFQQMAFKEPSFRHSLAATGVDPGIISNRISHVFNLNGPSIVVNTACSSSVYAMHNACNALRNKECSAAVVGGVNLVLTVDQHMNTAKLGVLSPTSTCHTFDVLADGYGRAEGVGAVYLKRLSDAVRDGDPVRGLIRSSATNSNGKVPAVGITHPNLDGQANVIKKAYERGGLLDPRLTGYFECHGTGTAVGDPLEVHAVANAMNENRQSHDGPLFVGAVKTNIGHSEAASGLSAVIKAILTVERGIIPPTKGVANPNPAIDWEKWKVQVPVEPTPFPSHLPVKRVSVNSFGYGGTNAHIVVESADSFLLQPQTYKYNVSPTRSKAKSPRGAFNRNRPYLLLFSAHDKQTLKRIIEAYGGIADNYNLLDLSYTLANRRTHFQSRGIVVASHANIKNVFKDNLNEFIFAEKKKTPSIGFVFTGQGAQWPRMGAELMTYYPSFLRSIRYLDMALGDLEDPPDWTLEDALIEDPKSSRVNEAEFSQPLCTAIQVALVQLLGLWGIRPKVTCGHSSGEIAAAFAAGLVSASEAIILAYYRGKVVRDINTNGAMLAVGLGAEAIKPYLEKTKDEVVVACHNSPAGVTLSGNADLLETLRKDFTADNVFARSVNTNGKAYHSHHMHSAAAKYEALTRRARLDMPLDLPLSVDAKMVSTVTNSILSEGTILDETYWSANLLNPVLFNQAVQTIATAPEFAEVDMLIEIGPHSALSGPIRQIKAEYKFENIQYLPTLIRGADSASSLLTLAGELYLRNFPLDIERLTVLEKSSGSGKISCEKGCLIVDLPSYRWDEGKKFWAEARQSREHRAPRFPRHDLLGSMTLGGSLAEPTWRNVLRIRDLPWLQDHFLGGEAVFPAAGYFSMAMEAITQLNELQSSPATIEGYVLRDIAIKNALVTPDDDAGVEVLLTMRPSLHGEGEAKNAWWDFNVSSMSETGCPNNHMAGSIGINTRPQRPSVKTIPNLPQRASGKAWNKALKDVGFDYGPTFQDMDDIYFDGKTYVAACKTHVKTEVGKMTGESRHVLHPASIDSCLQLLIVAIYAGRTKAMSCGAVPIQVDEVAIWKPTDSQINASTAQAFSWIDQRGFRSFVGGSQLVASDGEVLLEISDMRCSLYEAAVPQRASEPSRPRPYGEMVWDLDLDSLGNSQQLDIPSYFKLADFKNPGTRVLEIGSEHVETLFDKVPDLHFTATEKTAEATEHLAQKLGNCKNAKVQTVDLTLDLASQAIKEFSFDLVIASVSSSNDLLSIRKLLTAGGRAVLELSDPALLESLEGANLVQTGLELSATKGNRFIVANAVDATSNVMTNGVSHKILLVYRQKPPAVLAHVKEHFESFGYEVLTSKLQDSIPAIKDIVMLTDFESPLLSTITETEFAVLQRITSDAHSIMWASAGGLLTGRIPEQAMASGFLRSLTSEQVSLNVVTMDFDTENTSTVDIARIISQKALQHIEKAVSTENEYCVSKGQLYISRLVSNETINEMYTLDELEIRQQHFDPEQHIIGELRSGKVVFEDDHRAQTSLDPEAVEVKVSFTGLNKEDVLIISGSDYPTTFSHEIGGIVQRVGSAVKHFAVGDRVVGFSFDKFATIQRVRKDLLRGVEDPESLSEMASLPMAYGAALYGLKTLANLQAGETALILHGTGLAGAAAIKLAQALGGYPYVMVDAKTHVDAVMSQFGLDRGQVLLESELVQLVQANGQLKVDVMFSSGWVNASTARAAWRNIAPFGRFVDCGRKNVLSRSVLDTIPIHRGANYLAFDMLDLYACKPDILSGLLASTVSLYRQNVISALRPFSVKNLTELNTCVASFSDNFESGKTVIAHDVSDGLLDMLPTRPTLSLSSDATYLLVGCLGGLGRSLTSWMMKKGARNFAFLSRSGADSLQASILVAALEAAGANVQVMKGDASVRSDVDRAVREVPSDRPIRGVIQAAMVLKVCESQALEFCDGHNDVDTALGWFVPQHAVRELERLNEA